MEKCKRKAIEQNLRAAACPENMIIKLLILIESGQKREAERLLRDHRCHLLDCIHDDQKKLDCFDYLLQNMKEEGMIKSK